MKTILYCISRYGRYIPHRPVDRYEYSLYFIQEKIPAFPNEYRPYWRNPTVLTGKEILDWNTSKPHSFFLSRSLCLSSLGFSISESLATLSRLLTLNPSLASVLNWKSESPRGFFFLFFSFPFRLPFPFFLFFCFGFWGLGPFGSCLLWIYDSETREWVFLFFFLRMGMFVLWMGIFIFFENGYVCFVVQHGSVIQSKYIILFFIFCWEWVCCMWVCDYIYIYIYKIAVNPKQYTGIDWYPKYIVPLTKLVQPPVQYWLPCFTYLNKTTLLSLSFHASKLLVRLNDFTLLYLYIYIINSCHFIF